ncbi:hybrid sensor histidine kinase/response regulator [Lyngbya confervoides]|uniref:Response regulator n=1 Tax=Lyngbya confervoides BDU141951 TaxID=1574623 RepID=A0ABD4T5W3_9CYAN|nr:response regulator [Lyngbya confervoides]MCM1983818.1 response regulator [Lyngbya confervoides BDU141951]
MKQILVIEDEQSVRANILKILEFEGFKTIEAENGEVGVRLAREFLPDLIFCDIMMPVLNGYEVQMELGEDPRTNTIPFIFLTAKAERDDIRLAMNLGADDYLAKPFNRDELLESVFSRLDKNAKIQKKFRKKVNNIRNSITSSLPAELLVPLGNVRLFLEQLEGTTDIILPLPMREKLQECIDSSVQLERIIQNFLFYSLLEIARHDSEQAKAIKGWSTIETSRVIREISSIKALEAQRSEDLLLDLQSAKIQILEANFVKIIEEVLDNAFKFSSPGSIVQVKSSVDSGDLKILISDQGQGLSGTQVNAIATCKPLSHRLQGQSYIGLGLPIAKRLAEIHQGCFEIRCDNNFTEVEIRLPIVLEPQNSGERKGSEWIDSMESVSKKF